MSMGADIGGAVMEFVAREISGNIFTEVARFNKTTRETELKQTKVKDPIIIFFPNATSQVMSAVAAEKAGYLSTPKLLNLRAVDDADSVAGRFKFAMTNKEKVKAWLEMEDAVLAMAQSRNGRPVPEDCRISSESLCIPDDLKQKKESEAA